MKRCLLDSSFVIDLLNETAADENGPARSWMGRNPRVDLWVSPVTFSEVLEGASDPDAVRDALRPYRWQIIGRQHAERVAVLQRRSSNRMGENDAWQVAIADLMGAIIVGHDPKAFDRLGERYDDYRRQ
jgi:predicted nucleic acid-binding protein